MVTQSAQQQLTLIPVLISSRRVDQHNGTRHCTSRDRIFQILYPPPLLVGSSPLHRYHRRVSQQPGGLVRGPRALRRHAAAREHATLGGVARDPRKRRVVDTSRGWHAGPRDVMYRARTPAQITGGKGRVKERRQ